MKKVLLVFTLFFYFSINIKAQEIFYQENFEAFGNGFLSTTATGGWTSDTNSLCNYTNAWSVFATGDYIIDNKSLMISAKDPQCIVHEGKYFVDLAANTYVHTSVSSIGYQDLMLDFDWRGLGSRDGPNARDYGKVVYRLGTSGTWIELPSGGHSNGIYIDKSSKSHQTINLPSELNNVQFQLGFKWRNDTKGKAGYPAFVIDNITIKGCKLPVIPKITTLSVCLGSQLNPTAPAVPDVADPTKKGWQIETNITGTFTNISFPISATNAANYNGKKIRYFATNSCGTNYSNEVEIQYGAVSVYKDNKWSRDITTIPNLSADIQESYSTPNNKNLSVCTLLVRPNAKVEIVGNSSITVTNEIIVENNGSLTVHSDGNLVQVNDLAVNSGQITVHRTSPMKKNNYTYWSSPVAGQNLWGFSPGTSTSRIYIYNERDDRFYTTGLNSSSVFTPGKGYAVMAPATYNLNSKTDFDGKFTGTPNNGTKTGTKDLVFELSLTPEGQGFNMIGNPYPSNIDFEKLYALNSTKIYNTAYFWTNVDPKRPASSNGNGSAYSGNGYAIYNGTGGVSSTGPAAAKNGGTIPTQFIKVGQGFIVKARPGLSSLTDKNLIFNNSIRNGEENSNFFSKGSSSDRDRFWLQLTTPAENINTILIGYIPNASNDFEMDYDAPLLSVASDSFYSVLNENKLGIQGRAFPLNTQDVVQLGTKHFEAGNYILSLSGAEGIFANSQNIYLKDKQTGVITNLSVGSYTFTADKGENTGRFEIIYRPETILATDMQVKEEVQLYRDGNDFVLKAQTKKITAVEVYDVSGRLIYNSWPNSTNAVISSDRLSNGLYIVKIDQNGVVTGKNIIK